MTLPDRLGYAEELANERPSFNSRDDIGPTTGLTRRMMRYFMGNPTQYFLVTSASNVTPTQLPDDPRAQSAVLQVIGASMIYRCDGTNPSTGTEQILPVGTILYLTGSETIKGFIFAAVGATPCSLSVNYFD